MNIIPLYQALLLGLLQGVAELFPVSSLAQTILIPSMLGWQINQTAPDYLAFVVALHFATALALVAYFWRDWARVVAGFFRGLAKGNPSVDADSKLAWLLIAGTVVVGAVGFLFEKKIRALFEDPSMAWIVACVLVVNGIFMLIGDVVKKAIARRTATPEHDPVVAALTGRPVTSTLDYASPEPSTNPTGKAEGLSYVQGAAVGAAQTLALIPGISRSGVTIVGGLLAGLTYEQASRFSFMLATPVIFAAAALKVPKLFEPAFRDSLPPTLYASAVSFVAAYLSVWFLMKYFHTNRLAPFAWFCIVFGLFSVAMLKVVYPPGHPTGRVPEYRGTHVVEQDAPTTRQ